MATRFKRWTIYLFPTPEQDARAGQIVKRWDGRLKVNTATFKNADDAQYARHQLGEWGIEMLRQNPAATTFKTEDGFTFYLLPDGRVVDSLDEDRIDMSWPNLRAFKASGNKVVKAGARPKPTAAEREQREAKKREKIHQEWVDFAAKMDAIAKANEDKTRSNPRRARRRNPGPVNILATYSAADVGKHAILDAALEIADLAKSIPVPYVRTSVSQIGGPHRASTIVTVGFDPRETWTNGIFENSRYARFDVSPGPQFSPYAGKSTTEPTIELISGHGVPKFRKARFKTPAEAIAKIAKWASEAGGAKRNPKGGFRGNLFGADLALAKSIAKHTGALTWEYIDARPAIAARVKEARALGLTGLAAANFVFPAKGLPRQNPVPRASKAGGGPRYGSGPERYYISDTTAQHHARHLAPMTDENDHAGARLYLARTVLASPAFTEKVKDGNARMDRSHTSAHYHDNEAAWKANHALLKRMLAQVKRRTTPAGYAAIHGAF
jgi:hypothetical protein